MTSRKLTHLALSLALIGNSAFPTIAFALNKKPQVIDSQDINRTQARSKVISAAEKELNGQARFDEALTFYKDNHYHRAMRAFRLSLLDKNLSPELRLKATIADAECCYQTGDYGTAISALKKAQILLDKKETGSLSQTEVDYLTSEAFCDMGEMLYELDKHVESARYFKDAIDRWKQGKATDEVLLRSLEGLGASYFKDEFYEKALPLYQEVAYIDRIRYGAESTPYGWSLRVLNDIYNKLKIPDLAQDCFERSVWIFRNENKKRLMPVWTRRLANTKHPMTQAELSAALTARCLGNLGDIPDVKFIKAGAYTGVTSYKMEETAASSANKVDKEIVPDKTAASEAEEVAKSEAAAKADEATKAASTSTDATTAVSPAAPVTYRAESLPWARIRVAVHEPSSTIWTDPRVPTTGIVVCVPGFGLHRGSFSDLGESLSGKGFVVASYDVRGFGAYTALKARDRIDLEKSLDDLDDSIIQIRKDFENVPVFILGESMGGSIALQFVAQHPNLVEGLIASVPSEHRYRQWMTASKVALGVLTGSRKLIDVAPSLVTRATTKKDLRQTWAEDPHSRFTATAKELMGFRRFLSRNETLAKQVKTTPVIMYQGVHDLLIRPEGTISLFKAVSSEDKDLVLIGKSEHLLFEEGQFNVTLLTSLCDWMRNHTPKTSAPRAFKD